MGGLLHEASQTAWRLVAGAARFTPRLVLGVFAFGICYLIGWVVRRAAMRFAERKTPSRDARIAFGRLVHGAVLIGGLLIALAILFPSLGVNNLVQFLGITSVAIGFAFRDILQNFLAGILILFSSNFRVGDQIHVNEFEGTIQEIQSRSSLVRTYDGRTVVIPNSDLFTRAVIVNTAAPARRSEYDLNVGYGENIERVRGLILDAIRDIEDLAADPKPEVLALELGDWAVRLRVRWWSPSTKLEELVMRDRVISAIKKTLQGASVELPFPTRTVLLHEESH